MAITMQTDRNTVPAEVFSGTFIFPHLEQVIYEPGSLDRLGGEIGRLQARKAFIIMGRTIAGKTNFLDQSKAEFGGPIAGSFDRMLFHTLQDRVLDAMEARRADADLLVSMGGGSSVDGANMVALCLAEGIERQEDFSRYRMRLVNGTGVAAPVKGTVMAHIAIPATLSGAVLQICRMHRYFERQQEPIQTSRFGNKGRDPGRRDHHRDTSMAIG